MEQDRGVAAGLQLTGKQITAFSGGHIKKDSYLSVGLRIIYRRQASIVNAEFQSVGAPLQSNVVYEVELTLKLVGILPYE